MRRFVGDRRAMVASVELVMLALPATLLVLAIVQLMMLARATVVIEHAAYAAARSALVHRCRPVVPLQGSENLFSTADAFWGALSCDESEADAQALRAAQLALIPIGASSTRATDRGNCIYPEAAVEFIMGAGVRPGLRGAVENKICYVFEQDNVAVEVDWSTTLEGVSIVRALPTLEATVVFRMPVFIPVRALFSDGQRDDGSHYREITATVSLL